MAAAVPPPAVGQPMPDAPPVTASAEIANYGSFDANGNFNLNPGVAANTKTNFFQVKPNGTKTELNVGQLKLFLARGLLNRDGSVPASSPLPIVHTPPPSLAALLREFHALTVAQLKGVAGGEARLAELLPVVQACMRQV